MSKDIAELVSVVRSCRRYIKDERDWLENSYCSVSDGEPDLATMDDAGKPLHRRQTRLLARVDAALARHSQSRAARDKEEG